MTYLKSSKEWMHHLSQRGYLPKNSCTRNENCFMVPNLSLFGLFHILFPRCECLDYLCDIAVQMKSHGLDPTEKPKPREDMDNGIL